MAPKYKVWIEVEVVDHDEDFYLTISDLPILLAESEDKHDLIRQMDYLKAEDKLEIIGTIAHYERTGQ